MNLVEYRHQLVEVLGSEHADARVAEVGNPLEQRRGGKVAAYVQDAPVLVYALDALGDLALDEVKPRGQRQGLGVEPGECARDVVKHPRGAYRGASQQPARAW